MGSMRGELWIQEGRRLLVASLLLALLVPAAVAQDEPEAFGDTIEVRVINLEVKVTDADGNHISDLAPGDFRLRVDGEEVPIGYFSEIRDRHAVGSPTADAGAGESSGGEPSFAVGAHQGHAYAAGVAPGERVGTSFLVFVDNAFGTPQDRDEVLRAMSGTVEALGEGDQMAIVGFDGRQLKQIGDWSRSGPQLKEGLEAALAAPAYGLQRQAALRTFEQQRRRQGSELIAEGDSLITEDYIRDLSGRIERALQAATSALRAFSDPSGRKVMLLASGGWPRDPAGFAVGFNPNIRSRTRHDFPDAAFEELVGTANRLGYTLYPIDVPGNKVRGRGFGADERVSRLAESAEGTGSGLLDRLGASDLARPPVLETELATEDDVLSGGLELDDGSYREVETEATLIELAERTGGRALLNSQRLASLSEVVADTASYYWLGFTSDRKRDGGEYEIEIAVDRPGAKVRSRSGFNDLSRSQEAAMEVESNLLADFDAGLLEEDLLQVELGTPEVRRRIQQPVTLHVPLDEIVMLPGAEGYSGQLELRVASIDEKGARSSLPLVLVPISGPTEPQPGQVVLVDVVLELRKIRQTLQLAVHDLTGDSVLTTSLEYEPPASR
ncbi:MAG: VWA domain-containing protein [Acidobacteriota bacterium]